MPCGADGCQRAATRRCRFCRAVGYCSSACARAHSTTHQRAHAYRCIFLPPVPSPPSSSSARQIPASAVDLDEEGEGEGGTTQGAGR